MARLAEREPLFDELALCDELCEELDDAEPGLALAEDDRLDDRELDEPYREVELELELELEDPKMLDELDELRDELDDFELDSSE